MKAYFVASLAGKQKYQENYKQIYQTLKKLGLELLSDHILTTDPKIVAKISEEEEKKFYNKMRTWIKKSDVFIAEVSYRSTNVGHEISLAISKNKPVILLHVKDQKPILFKGLDSEKVQVIEYSPHSLYEDLEYALNYAKGQQDSRFNFFIDPGLQNYLDWIAKTEKIPRSVFLRDLIQQHMENNPDY